MHNISDYTVDDQSPDTLRGEATDPSTVELTWEPSAYNCEVLGYTIYIQEGINSMVCHFQICWYYTGMLTENECT